MVKAMEIENLYGPGTVSRVVAGRLVYVDIPASHGTVAVTPEKIEVEQSDGSVRVYRGEPFDDLGIEVGAKVEARGNRFLVKPLSRRRFRFGF